MLTNQLRSIVIGCLGFLVVCGLGVGAVESPRIANSQASPAPDRDGGVIRGVVRAQGRPVPGVRVRASHPGRPVATSVFTGQNGQYEFPPFSPGIFNLSVGTRWNAAVTLSGGESRHDFDIDLGMGLMNQTSGSSWFEALPGTGADKERVYKNCTVCHSTWRLIDQPASTAEGWANMSRRMATITSSGRTLDSLQAYRVDIEDANIEALSRYLTAVIQPPVLAEHMSKALILPTGEAARAVFREWDLSKEVGRVNMTWTSPEGLIWFNGDTLDGRGLIGSLDPRTDAVNVWPSDLRDPNFHDIWPDPDGNVWVTASKANKIVKFDTQTYRYTFWDVPDKFGRWAHTGDFDPDGNFWFTLEIGEGAVGKLDPRTGEMTHFPTISKDPDAYGLKVDLDGNVWFTELRSGKLGRIERKTGKLTEYDPPTPGAGPRRIQMDSRGRMWFSEYYASKIGVIDPKTLQILEYDIGIPGGRPYFLKVDKQDRIWFNLLNHGVIGRFDPDTRKFTFFLFPEPETHSRDASFDYSTDPFAIVYSRPFLGPGSVPTIGRMYVRAESR